MRHPRRLALACQLQVAGWQRRSAPERLRQEGFEGSVIGLGHVYPKAPAGQPAPLATQQALAGQVRLGDHPPGIQREIADGSKIVEFGVARRRRFQRGL